MYSIYSFFHSSMAIQPFVGPWPFPQFRNHFYTDGRILWTIGQPVARPLPIHRTKQTHTYPYLEWDSNPRSQVRASEDSSCLRPRDHCDGHNIYINVVFLKIVLQVAIPKLYPRSRQDFISGLLGVWTLSIVRYSKNTEEHNVSETGSVSVFR
jgi:hypothetical protein